MLGADDSTNAEPGGYSGQWPAQPAKGDRTMSATFFSKPKGDPAGEAVCFTLHPLSDYEAGGGQYNDGGNGGEYFPPSERDFVAMIDTPDDPNTSELIEACLTMPDGSIWHDTVIDAFLIRDWPEEAPLAARMTGDTARRFWITDCPDCRPEVTDNPERIDSFDALLLSISEGRHDVDYSDLAKRLRVDDDEYIWDNLRSMIDDGALTADDIDSAVHAGLR